ncbi:MAG: DUF3105 domain-containing protein [Actinomycetota bacterium]
MKRPMWTLATAAATLTYATACGGDDNAEKIVAPDGTQAFGNDLAHDHLEGDLDYDQTPPVGGAHNPVWQNCGVYDEPVLDENAVHSMEHGAVWIAYAEDLPADEVATLTATGRSSTFVLVTPYPGLEDPIVLGAWGYQLRVDDADDPRVQEFVDTFANGPQTPEPGAPCLDGIGDPS